jgi:protein O-GlcNAc transferase
MHSNLLLGLLYSLGDDGAAIRAEHDGWARRHAPGAASSPAAGFRDRDRDPGRRLRVGYLSPDFRLHSVAFFFEPLIRAHDRRVVEVFCYSDVRNPDDVTGRIREQASQWRDAHTLDDDALRRQIADDRIDILVDLAGHTGFNRMPMLAQRAAPVQASYLGYPATTGLATVDYWITDALGDPPDQTDAFFTEKLWRLPGPMHAYTGDARVPLPGAPPAESRGAVTFGSFNHLQKITDETMRAWSEILRRVPDGRLRVKAIGLAADATRESVRERFIALGGDDARFELLRPEDSVGSHLARYGEIDIALDTFPYICVTTTFEALWMGVPVITRVGRTHVARMGASILGPIGLDELAVRSDAEYVDRAVALAGDRGRLRELRTSLRTRLAGSSLCDPVRLARQMEQGYRAMWTAWCSEPARRAT